MSASDGSTSRPSRGPVAFIEGALHHFAFYTVPVAIVVATLLTLLVWDNNNDFGPGSFHAIYMVEGGILALSLLLLAFAAFARNWLYVLFSGWLIANLRLTALSLGWDAQWLGQTIPYHMLPMLRALTIALYYVLTYALFVELFKTDLKRVGYNWLQMAGRWIGILLLVAAYFLPYEQFVPVMWVLTALGAFLSLFLLRRILAETQSSEALWYGLALVVVIGVGSGLFTWFVSVLNLFPVNGTFIHAAAAFISSALIALVIAANERIDRRDRIQAQAELDRFYEATPIGLFTLEVNGIFLRTNPALKSMLGIRANRNSDSLWEDYFGVQSWLKLKQSAEHLEGTELEIQNLRRNETVPRRSFLVKAIQTNGRIEGSLQDITGHADTITKLRILADHDPLTDALNRRGIEANLRKGLKDIDDGSPFALAYLDLTSLKTINDLYGHTAGDDVLKEVSERVKAVLRDKQLLGRSSGAEFLILFHDTPIKKAAEVSQEVLDRLQATPCKIGTGSFDIKASIGLVEITNPQIETQDAILMAKRASRIARKSKTNNLIVQEHSAQKLAEQSQELQLLRQFNSGFSPKGLHLVMQPIMSLSKPFTTLNFEVLLRMNDAKGAPVPAIKIIAAAEESGVIASIDRWVFGTTLRWLHANIEKLKTTEFVCINLNGMSLNDEQFIEDFFNTLAHYEPVAKLLCIEITESVALHDLENTRRFILRLQSLGVRIALDDFGAGYTSFSYLKQLPADALKIDGEFIRSMNDHPADVAIVKAIVSLAQSLGMKSIAEWVEDCATLETLANMGVDYVQGYIIAKPQSPDDILLGVSGAGFIQDSATTEFVQCLNTGIA